MSKFARDPYVVAAGCGWRGPLGRHGRRVGALALYLDAAGDTYESAAWEFVDAAFRVLANMPLEPGSKSKRSVAVRLGEQRRRYHRTLDALYLRYVLALPLREVGRRLREPVTTERCRQIIAKGLRILRHPSRFAEFRAAVARELDETTNPMETRGEQFCDYYAQVADEAPKMCGLQYGHEGFCGEWRLALFAPGSTDGEALEARDGRRESESPVVEPGVERAIGWCKENGR